MVIEAGQWDEVVSRAERAGLCVVEEATLGGCLALRLLGTLRLRAGMAPRQRRAVVAAALAEHRRDPDGADALMDDGPGSAWLVSGALVPLMDKVCPLARARVVMPVVRLALVASLALALRLADVNHDGLTDAIGGASRLLG